MSTHNMPLSIYKRKSHEIIPNIIMSAAMGFFFLGTLEQVRNSRGKRAIGVRAIKVLLYVHLVLVNCLGGLSVPRRCMIRLTDCSDMTIAVYCRC